MARSVSVSPVSSATRGKILAAATKVFADKGFDGARIDAIAAESGINKERLYHHFGSKDQLFTAVLEQAYRGIREAEAAVDLDSVPADEAVARLVMFTWQYYLAHPEFPRLLNSENQLEARHVKANPTTPQTNAGHIARLERLVARGRREQTIRPGVDAVQLGINLAALSFFYLMNRHTLSIVYRRDLGSPASLKARLAVMQETMARWIAP